MSTEFKKRAAESMEVTMNFRVSESDQRQLERLTFFGNATTQTDSMSRVTATRPATEEEGRLWDMAVNCEAAYRAKMFDLEETKYQLDSARARLRSVEDQLLKLQEQNGEMAQKLEEAENQLEERHKDLAFEFGTDAYKSRDSLGKPKP